MDTLPKLLSSVTPKGSFGRSRRMNPQAAGPERAFQDDFFLFISSRIFLALLAIEDRGPDRLRKWKGWGFYQSVDPE